jgi:hypothetical protein
MGRFHDLLLSTLFASLAFSALAEPESKALWLGPEGQPLPFFSHQEAKAFLNDARIVEKKELSSGTTRPWKVRLEKDGLEAHAIFRSVDVKRDRVKIEGKTHIAFHDSALYECAAYELSQMLHIKNVPPCVLRRFEGTSGTLQLWIEEAMTELERRQAKMPSSMNLARDRQTLRLFDALIANIDRNQGNLLIDSSDQLWFIDHTRSFGVSTRIGDLSKLVWSDRQIWEALQSLKKKEISDRLGPFVDGRRILALMKRKEKVIQHIQERIADLGAGAVLFDEGTVLDDLSDIEIATAEADLPRNTSLPLING